MNSEPLFSLALNLQSPWEVKEMRFPDTHSNKRELHLHIGFISGSKFADKANERCPVHDTVDRLQAGWNRPEEVETITRLQALGRCDNRRYIY